MSIDLRDNLRSSDLVKEKEIGEGLYAYNFTRDAFRSGQWDETSIKARGMFMTEDGQIVGRGFEKFFNLGERPETTLESVCESFVMPVTAEYKSNGYLGLIFSVDGVGLKVFSKGGPTNYGDNAASILAGILSAAGVTESDLAAYLAQEKVTLAVEVIDPDHDPHLVDEGARSMVLLATITNEVEFSTREDVRAFVSSWLGVSVPTLLGRVTDRESLKEMIASLSEVDCEGAVLIDAQGRRVKIKSESYSAWKDVRGVLERTLLLARRSGEVVAISECGRTPRTDLGREILNQVLTAGVRTSEDLARWQVDGVVENQRVLDMISLRRMVEDASTR